MTTTIHTPIIPGYKISEQLYAGSRTRVYRAFREQDSLAVVIKLLTSEYPTFNDLLQFCNQYTISKNLKIPGIIHPLSLEVYGNGYILVMEDTGEISLKEYIRTNSLSLGEFLVLAIQLADILQHLYQNRVIHKDIKPANILIHPETRQVKLIDFSIASLLVKETQEIKSPNVLEGTLAYISPEQTGRMNRGIDYRSDFYSLGVTFFEILTGQLPFRSSDPMELVHCHIAQQATRISKIELEIPQIISEIIVKLMAKNAEDRYQSALGLKQDLEICLYQLKDTGEIKYFEIGQRDLCAHFLIPEKIYGREVEVKTLLDVFERVANGNSEMMLVAGFSGIGKTAVVNEVHKPITRQQGYFLKGKFDQFNRNIPFSAFVQAFRSLMGQLLSQCDTDLANWKAKILEALGENGQVIIDVIPELEGIIGQQPTVPELSGSAAQNRFNLLFGKFVRVFTTKEHPLVIFLDDLQWADSASLNLLKLLMDESEAGYLLVLGAYRDNEVFPAHPLILTLDDILRQGANINTLTLAPLDEVDITRLVADTLLCAAEIAMPLSQLVYKKTWGNPFFTTQFLKGLHEDGWITFKPEAGYWQCDLTQVRQLALTDDVVEFMVGRLRKLPEATQAVLKLAACIGNQFDLVTLAVVCEESQEKVATDLWRSLQEGFVIPDNQTYKFFQGDKGKEKDFEATIPSSGSSFNSPRYRFLHDRVQQAAYSLISQKQKPATHYHIGQLLLNNLSEATHNEMLFDIVNHINFGQHLINDQKEQEKLAQLNLAAGQKAISSTAYEVAIKYLETGIGLLGENAWINQYNLIFSLYRNLAAAQLSNATYEQLQETITVALQQVNSPIDRADIYGFQVIQRTLQGQYEEAIQAGLIGLKNLGIETRKNNLKEFVHEEFAIINKILGDRPVSSLLDLPTVVDPTTEAAIKLLIIVEPTIYITANIELYSLVSLKAVRLSIEHGNIPESVKAYVNYGLLLGLMEGQYQRGYEFADLAVQLSYKLNSKSQRCKAGLLLGAWIQAWAKPITGAANINYESFLAGLESGETQFAAYNLFGNIFNRLFQGENLAAVAKDIEKYGLLTEQFKDELLSIALAGAKIFTNKLCLGQDAREQDSLISEAEKIIHSGEVSQAWFAVGLYYILLMHLSCLTANFEEGLNYATKAGKILNSVVGFTTYSGYFYYGSLILLNLYSGLSQEEQSDALEQIRSNQEQLRKWSDNCPENFLHKYLLIESEHCRCLGKKLEAIDLYDRAIVEAKKNNYIQEEALANELAAKFYLDWGKEKFAAGYMEEAYYCYVRWGAKAKVEHLEQHYPQLLAKILQPKNLTITPGTTIASTQMRSLNSTNSSQNLWLDLPAIIKAAQAISQEIELEKLLVSLMQIAITNAGAQSGHLILYQDEQWLVVAQAGQAQTGKLEIPLTQYQKIPQSVIYSVVRTQEVAVFENLSKAAEFAGERYIITHQPKSVLCTPIIRQGKLVGILYLENNLTVGAFTSDRIEILQILTSQAAISLENAFLYQQTENYSQILKAEVERKTQALHQKAQDLEQALKTLQQTQAQLIQNEKMSSLGQLVAGIAHEINNPINFIKGNLAHIKSYIADMMSLLTLYQQEYPQPSRAIKAKREEIEFDFLCEDVNKILESMELGSHRIRQIILSLRNFSRLDESSIKPVDLHSGIESTLLILQHRFQGSENKCEIRVVKEYGNLPTITCYPSQLNQVFLNIINNAIDAIRDNFQSGENPEIRIRTEVIDSKWVRIAIANTDSIIPVNIQERVFDPFFTTKPVGRGTGLGLFVSYSIIQNHGGTLSVRSQLGQGTEFEIMLPHKSAQIRMIL